MLAVLTCIGVKHDLRLVVLAALICAIGAATAMGAHARARRVATANRSPWLLLAGAACGAGVWATHFVAMLAYSPGLPIQFRLDTTALSLTIAIVGASCAFALAETGRGRPLLAGVLLGASATLMHYCGVAAIQAFQLHWRPVFVASSLVIAVLGSIVALRLGRGDAIAQRIGAPLALIVGVCGLHFTAMTALEISPDPMSAASPELISRPVLAIAVGFVVSLILAGAILLILLETQARRSSVRTLKTVFESAPEGFALFDPMLKLVLWNNAYRDLIAAMGVEARFGLTETALHAGIAASGWLTTEHFAALAAPGDNLLTTTEGSLPDGRILHIERRRLEDGSRLSIYTDVTEQRRWAQSMQDAREKAESANRAKTEFLANMGHELRTPLNGVIGMVQAIEQNDLGPEQRVRVEVVHESANALLRIVDDVLDLAKIEGGRSERVVETFELAALALSVSSIFASAAVKKGLKLKVAVSPEAAGWWLGDAGKLRRMLGHLIDNGIKFTATGGVTLDVAKEADGLMFRVKDTGIGFDPVDSGRLFESFVQADASATRRFGGAGVGLSLCREWAQVMGGDISADGRPGEGACFTVRLPFERVSAPEPAPVFELFPRTTEPVAPAPEFTADQTPAAAQEPDYPAQPDAAEATQMEERPLRILAAEDNETNQLVLRSLLQTMEVDLTMVVNGKLAVEAFTADPFDLVLMDIQMPEMNGVDSARAIRAFEREHGRPQTPIIALTANVMPDQLAEYRAAGMNDCVGKPIQLETLFNVMAAALTPGLEAAA